MRRIKIALIPLLAVCFSAFPGSAVLAQPLLVSSFPQANETLQISPGQVRLTFDRMLDDSGVEIAVLDGGGQSVDLGDLHVDPANRFTASVSLPALANGSFTVRYWVAALGGSTSLHGEFRFAVATLPPELIIRMPEDGARLEPGPINLSFDMRYADFSLYETTINLYLDDQPAGQIKGLSAQIPDPPQGVHQVRAVISQYGVELGHTSQEVTVVIVAPDEELLGREAAASAPPDQGLAYSAWQMAGLLALLSVLIFLGSLLGRRAVPRDEA